MSENEHIDLESLASLQNHLANLTGLSLYLLNPKGDNILPPVNEGQVLSAVKSSTKGISEYNDFVRKSVGKAVHNTDVSVFKGTADQYYFFAPLCISSGVFVVAGGGVYLSDEDFNRFWRSKKDYYGLSAIDGEPPQPLIVNGLSALVHTARYIRSILNLVIRGCYRDSVNEKRYRVMKIVMGLISDMKIDREMDSVFDVLADIILFLFNTESLSILIRDNGSLKSLRTAGRLKERLGTDSLPVNGVFSEVLEKQTPVYTDSVADIMRSGLGEEVLSVHAFPIISESKVLGILNIINSPVMKEDADIIQEICRAAGLMLRVIEMQETYQKHVKDISELGSAAESISPVMDSEKLYETILETSVRLAEAEKGSLMLTDNGSSFLTIKAARGIQKRVLDAIRIKAGEGIAGKVFQEGVPLIVEDIEKSLYVNSRHKHKYKTGSFISIPLKAGDKTIGVLNISDKITGEIFSEEDMALLRSFASYATIALERSNYYNLAGYLRELSITDALTGLFNRRYFEERFFEELHRSERHNLAFSLAMIDIDDFKTFNDTEGHLAGDEILRTISYIAKDNLRISDVIARFGGEEFAVIMPQTSSEEALHVAERIRNSVREMIPRNWKEFPKESVTVSIGIATFPQDGRDRKELIRNADRALYRSKMEGKDRTSVWTA